MVRDQENRYCHIRLRRSNSAILVMAPVLMTLSLYHCSISRWLTLHPDNVAAVHCRYAEADFVRSVSLFTSTVQFCILTNFCIMQEEERAGLAFLYVAGSLNICAVLEYYCLFSFLQNSSIPNLGLLIITTLIPNISNTMMLNRPLSSTFV